MEFFYGSSNDMQAYKVHSFDGNVSPINAQNFIGRGRFYPGSKTPTLDPYVSSESTGSSSNIVSPLARYLCPRSPLPFTSDSPKHRSLVNTSSGSRSGSGGGVSRSPLASLENIEIPLMFRTPVKVEEDVVVMDGILVEPKHGPRAKLSPSTSDSGGRLSSSTSGKDNSFHKSETCRWWEDSGSCRFGSKCRFVHGKEDLRPTAFANRNSSEALLCRSYSSGSSSYGPRGRSVHHQVHSTAPPTEAAEMSTPTTTTTLKVFTKDKEPSSSDSSTTSTSTGTISGTDWCPLDDNIEVTLPSSGENCASREDVDAHIQTVLYGPSGRKRLPVFIDFAEE
ncbi:uncharacterized protein LOC129877778 [Solanum dulcamara]|uniref:uncharacterized protein LOC129877778 n=1 Tax=Solanum dulcamara TaxID=45834 RepID=UPI002486A764|nr:uncharacterized protein LOC129877778 [Solanum dulcamara]XP_055809284.1 uncharacterized protein LOC129877778 [Solanum dulcamara]XP_055809285.1 uncharacterized protein LOC129877778 [Solanum dulcamara]XP_055809286.1 uncharacterized protein LOC129877778 [Solanum dulcamara]XP_055809287.1 uncharacterized protein LOC129877778 [Solanum dulcamara]XP_055809288.1 uncharacterized protein LOC129877778 [Solanum dulcamara]